MNLEGRQGVALQDVSQQFPNHFVDFFAAVVSVDDHDSLEDLLGNQDVDSFTLLQKAHGASYERRNDIFLHGGNFEVHQGEDLEYFKGLLSNHERKYVDAGYEVVIEVQVVHIETEGLSDDCEIVQKHHVSGEVDDHLIYELFGLKELLDPISKELLGFQVVDQEQLLSDYLLCLQTLGFVMAE